jgi:hypothetical protein
MREPQWTVISALPDTWAVIEDDDGRYQVAIHGWLIELVGNGDDVEGTPLVLTSDPTLQPAARHYGDRFIEVLEPGETRSVTAGKGR